MPTFSSPPILVWEPGGGVPVGPISNPPVYSQAGTTQLVEGQAYVDVVFGSIQTDDDWVLVECVVVNEIDAEPLNIWPGIITDKAQAGFRLQLNGMPDSGNYYLHWAVSGVNIAPTPATLYLFSGPASGGFHTDSTVFTVSLPPSTTVTGTVTVTPDDAGAGGTFTPTSVALTSASRSVTFTYNPVIYGAILISVTNDGGLIDPADLVLISVVTEYDLSGPSSGSTGTPSTNFTVALPVGGVIVSTITVTPSDGGGGGTFTPTSVALTVVAPSATFTYTPATDGTKTISVTNNGGLTNPASIVYTASTPFSPASIAGLELWLKADDITTAGLLRALKDTMPEQQPGSEPIPEPKAGVEPLLADGTALHTWPDSSGNGYDVTQGAVQPPTYKSVGGPNGKPYVQFDGADDGLYTFMAVSQPDTIIVVYDTGCPVTGGGGDQIFNPTPTVVGMYAGTSVDSAIALVASTFIVQSIVFNGASSRCYVNGASVLGPASCGTNGITAISIQNFGPGSAAVAGKVAEVLVYNSALSDTDRQNVELYLQDKYAL